MLQIRHRDISWIPNGSWLSMAVDYTGQQTMPCTPQVVCYIYRTERFGIQPFTWLSAVPSTVLTGQWETPALHLHTEMMSCSVHALLLLRESSHTVVVFQKMYFDFTVMTCSFSQKILSCMVVHAYNCTTLQLIMTLYSSVTLQHFRASFYLSSFAHPAEFLK